MEEGNIQKEKIIEIMNIIAIAMVLFASFVIENSKYLVYVLIILFAVVGYTIFLAKYCKKNITKTLSRYSIVWILFFSIEMFIYGYFGKDKLAYSLKYHMLNIIWIISILFILNYNSKKIVDNIAKACGIIIVIMSLFIICTNDIGIISFIKGEGEIKRIGYTAVGNVNTTAITYIFLLIPVLYKVLVQQNKKYIPIAIVDIIFMLLTGSKKGIISILIILGIICMSNATTKKKKLRNIGIFRDNYFNYMYFVLFYTNIT